MRYDAATRLFHAGPRRWPVHEAHVDDTVTGGFDPLRRRQVLIRFETGYEASIVWGDLTYSSNHDCRYGTYDGHFPTFTEEPETVEVAVFDRDDNMLDGGVLSYLDADDVNVLLDGLARGEPPSTPG